MIGAHDSVHDAVHDAVHAAVDNLETSDTPQRRIEHLRGLPGLSALDRELACFAARLAQDAPLDLLLAVALASRCQACGHTALDLSLEPDEVLSLVPSADPTQTGQWSLWVGAWLMRMRHTARGGFQALAPWPALFSNSSNSAAMGSTPSSLLVWSAPRLYLNRAWTAETRVAALLRHRATGGSRAVGGSQAVVGSHTPLGAPDATQTAQRLLDIWFSSETPTATADQKLACLSALNQGLTVITGGPGTGKTYTAARLLALLQACRPPGSPPLRMALAAPTGKAAARLRQAMDQAWLTLDRAGLSALFWAESREAMSPAQTIHALLGPALGASDIEHLRGVVKSLAVDVLLVDEASMLDLALTESLLQALPQQAHLVLLGDRHQLASVEAGSVLADMVEGISSAPSLQPGLVASLSRSRRFTGAIGQWADAVLQGRIPECPENSADSTVTLGPMSPQALCDLALSHQGWGELKHRLSHLHEAVQSAPEAAIAGALRAFEQFRILCAVRRGPYGVDHLNSLIEQALLADGGGGPPAPTGHGRQGMNGPLNESEWVHGRAVMITRNNPSLGLSNGDVGLVLCIGPGGSPRFYWLEGSTVRHVACSRLAHAETAFAMTVHKSQGSEFDRVAVVLPAQGGGAGITRELIYTGITRARQRLWLVADAPTLLQAVRHPTRRMGGLAECLAARLGEG